MRSGRDHEQQAAAWLKSRGYVILEQNYRTPRGEIDIIARDGDTICFVEVKGRTQFAFGAPAEAVTRRKQAKIIRTAGHYLARNFSGPEPACRFDVVSLDPRGEMELIADAFQVPMDSRV